jgi:hypothetical protein
MAMLDQNQLKNKTGTNVEVTPMEQGREEVRQFLEALQAAESLLQDPASTVFVTRCRFELFKEFEALFDSFPFRSEVPLSFRSWWERSEPKRQDWLDEMKSKSAMLRRSYFVLTSIPLNELGSDAYAGSVFLVLASKDEKRRIRFLKAASGFLVLGTMANAFRHSPESFANPERNPTA